MVPTDQQAILKLAVPKGRMHDGVLSLLAEAGMLPASCQFRWL
jgi:ATP phosphoribosyltransferase